MPKAFEMEMAKSFFAYIFVTYFVDFCRNPSLQITYSRLQVYLLLGCCKARRGLWGVAAWWDLVPTQGYQQGLRE